MDKIFVKTPRLVDSKYMKVYLFCILFMLWGGVLFSQSPLYSVKKTSFSSGIYDEFSPYQIKDGIVYCSNRPKGSMTKYTSETGFLFNMYFVKNKKSGGWGKSKLFANELNTKFNDGPATFNNDKTTIYFSRNIYVQGKRKNISGSNNKIGLFSANYINGVWTNITSFPHNGTDYSLISPSISIDGTKIYFSSDKPGGYGGYDIYYSLMADGQWQQPVNMGSTVNTPSDETHPYISADEKLFFASEGHPGLGGKDIFYVQQSKDEWIGLVHLDTEINSASDDFGLVTDDNLKSGYFSSNRKNTDDIYHFQKKQIEFENCKEQLENNYCFVFYDENVEMLDTVASIYEWDFGSDEKLLGKKVKYCFPGPGEYSVTLRVTNGYTGDTINIPSPYGIELKDYEQAYINSVNDGKVGDTIYFDGLKNNILNFEVEEYLWDFGKGFDHSGDSLSHQFIQAGEYKVKLGLIGVVDSGGEIRRTCVYKRILITEKD